MQKLNSPTKVGIFNEKRKRKRIINAKEFQFDMKSALQGFFTAFNRAVVVYNDKIKSIDPRDRVRSFEASFFNTCLMQTLREILGVNIQKGRYGRMYLYINGYIVLFKKLDKYNMPMNVRTNHLLKIENQQEGNLFSDEEDGIAPIIFFGYSKSSIGELVHPRFVYIDEEMVKWTLDEFGVPQKETTLFTSLSDVETVHPKVRVKNKEGKIKAIK